MKKLLMILLLITCITSVKAYENDYFSIDIPDNYKEEINGSIFKWTNDNKYIAVTINDNVDKYDVEKYTDEDLKEQKRHLEETYSKELEEYNVTVEVSDIKRNTVNEYSILEYDLYWNSEKYTGYNMYQKGAIYTTSNYIYTIIISSDEEIQDKDYKKIINSFYLKDEPIIYTSNIFSIIIVGGIVLGIIGFILEKNKEHK